MSQASNLLDRGRTRGGRGALLLAALLAACGDPAGSGPTAPASAPGGPKPAATRGVPAPVVNDFLPPKPPRIVEQVAPDVEACIEQRIHGKEYDSLSPRDTRRKLRRLQLKAECQEQLAAR